MTISGWKKLKNSFNLFIKKAKKINIEIAKQANVCKTQIVTRTLNGKDVNNDNFAAYKKSNKNVDLCKSGKMLSSIRIILTKDGANIDFDNNNEEKIANANHFGTKNIPSRKFFGLSKNQKKQIVNNLKKRIKL